MTSPFGKQDLTSFLANGCKFIKLTGLPICGAPRPLCFFNRRGRRGPQRGGLALLRSRMLFLPNPWQRPMPPFLCGPLRSLRFVKGVRQGAQRNPPPCSSSVLPDGIKFLTAALQNLSSLKREVIFSGP